MNDMTCNNRRLCRLSILLLMLVAVSPLFAASVRQTVKVYSLADIQQRIQAVKDKQNLSEDLKNRILSAYYESEDNLNELQAQESQAESFKQAMTSVPLEAKQLARQIAEAENNLKNRKPEKFALYPTDELEQRLIIEKTKLSDFDAEISRVESQISEQINRPQLIREKIAEIKNKQQEQQALASKTGENLTEKEARQIQLETRIRVLNATLKTLERESISDPVRLQTQKDRIHLLNLQREYQSQLIADLDSSLLERRQQEIDKEQAALLQAEKAAEGKHPLIQAATRQNMQFNRSLQDVNKSMEQYLQQKNDIDNRYKQLEKDFQSAEQKITLAGLSPALGNLLREQRRNLPQRKQFSQFSEQIQNQIAQASLETFKLDELRKNLSDVGLALNTLITQQLPADMPEMEKLQIRTELRLLLNDQKELVARLSTVYAEYARVLGDVDFSLGQLLNAADKFSAYLDQRLLWVPSAPVINKDYLKDIFNSLLWFLTPANWLQVVDSFTQSIKLMPFLILLGGAIIALHWRFKNDLRQRLHEILARNRSDSTGSSIVPTLQGLLHVLLLSLSLPLMMVWFATVLFVDQGIDSFSRSMAEGLLAAAISLVVIQFFHRLFKPEGVAEVLLHWQPRTANLIYAQLQWTRFLLVPCIFITAMTGSDLFSEHSYALGRTALILLMLVIAYMFHRLTHPHSGIGKLYYQHSDGWISRFRFVWYGVALLLPLVIIGFAVAGYYQSALELQQKLIVTLRLVFLTALFQSLALRWLAITRRKLAIQHARQKHHQLGQLHGESGFLSEESLIDISKISQQGHKLLTTLVTITVLFGCWIIWRDILPAFSIFDRVELWQHTQLVDGKESLQPITLTNLLLCLAYAVVTFIFASNFPVLVDLLLTQRFAMTAGSRYALIQLVRYVLVSIAFLAIANELGGSWSQVQWLVAALGVGLGFGLQEIFANMVSGIILLFERPIRVGDTVTVGHVTGRVSRIQMRATHIVDWDRKELVVPNKVFITDQLINWTLSDTVTRIVVPISVAYGSEIAVVEQLFLDVIKNTELVLKDPQPNVVFNGFGDSSLHFDIQVFVRDLTDRPVVIHSLHKNIYAALQEHHIEIPYPQRDVHIRSVSRNLWPPQQAELIPDSK